MNDINKNDQLHSGLYIGVWIGILLVLLTPLIVSYETMAPYVIGKAIYSRILITITFATWLTLAICYPQYRPRISWVAILFAAWMAVSLVAGVFGVNPYRSLWNIGGLGLIGEIHWFIYAVVIASTLSKPEHWRILIMASMAVCFIVCILGILLQFGIDPLKLYVGDYFNWRGYSRMNSTIINPIPLGTYAAIHAIAGVGILVYMATREKTERASGQHGIPWSMIFCSAVVLVSLYVMLATGSRGALLAFGAGLIVMSVYYALQNHHVKLKLAGLVSMSIIAAGIVLMATVPVNTSPSDNKVLVSLTLSIMRMQIAIMSEQKIQSADSGMPDRMAVWGSGLKEYYENPIAGIGPGNFIVTWGRHNIHNDTDKYTHVHNNIIESLHGTGTIGAIFFISVLGMIIWVFGRLLHQPIGAQQFIAIILASVFLMLCLHNLLMYDMHSTLLMFVFPLAFAINAEMSSRRSSEVAIEPGRASPARPFILRSSYIAYVYGSISILLVMITVYQLDIRMYVASTYERDASLMSSEWTDIMKNTMQSERIYRWTANGAYLNAMVHAPFHIQDMAESGQLEEMASDMETLYEKGAYGDPENWEFPEKMVIFYYHMSMLDFDYYADLKKYIERLAELAPRYGESQRLAEIMQYIERIEQDGRIQGG